MVNVEWVDRGVQLSVVTGDRLLDAADERPQTGITFACRSGRCGTCRVRVTAGAKLISPAQGAERDTLRNLAASPDERLACQIRVDADAGRLRLQSVEP